ncbi:MAG: hypothetical protein WCT22_01565 [Patescibacteria group bacterium]|jgi:hypothetical protein
MKKSTESRTASDPFTEHSKKTIAALVTGVFATTVMILFFSARHLLPFNTPDLSPLETTARMLVPLALGMLESSRQNHLANRSLINGSGEKGMV